MQICTAISEMRSAGSAAHGAGKRLALVPTMGALHEGHLSLVRAARAKYDVVVVSIFVNPTQFGPNEDLTKYPRPFTRDCELLRNEKVDFVFAPTVEEMYPPCSATFVNVQNLSDRLCGKSRPRHFRGVTTVVSKLFNIVRPDVAFFGQKDAAQVAVIRAMVRDLNFPVEIVAGPIVRETDGLAMSSRNAYLTPQQRSQALALYRTLARVRELYDLGERDTEQLIGAGKRTFEREPAARLDYLEIVDPDTLAPLENAEPGALVAIAGILGTTRLIDNIVLP